MAKLAALIAPVDEVSIKVANKVQIALPSQISISRGNIVIDLPGVIKWQFENDPWYPAEVAPPFVELPLVSKGIYIPLLDPEKTESYQLLEQGDCDFQWGVDTAESKSTDKLTLEVEAASDGDLFSKLEISEQDIVDLTSNNKISDPNVQELSIELLIAKDIVNVSDNLLEVLLTVENIAGRLYADRYWKVERNPEYPNTARTKKQINQRVIYSKNPNEKGKQRTSKPGYKPGFWDLIFVLLQPPLTFSKNDNQFLPHELFPYQPIGINFLMSNQHALLADEMGTGKTVMTIVALKMMMRINEVKSALILCPPAVIYEWEQHLADWFPEAVLSIVRGMPESRSARWQNIPANIYLTSYDTLRGDISNGLLPKEKLKFFDVVVADEAHHLKNPGSGRSKAIKKLQPVYRWALTGTPIQNKIEDMAAMFDFIYPGYLTPYDLYSPEVMKNKIKPHFLRRLKKDVLQDLPPKTHSPIWLDMSHEQREEYFKAKNDIITEIEGLGATVTKQHIFAKMQRLKQICNFPTSKGNSPKLELLKEQLEEISNSGNKCIVFTQYVEQGIKKLEMALRPYGIAIIQGGQSDAIRRNQIYAFKNDENTSVLIASIKSSGEGLNLTEASYVIHFDHWWNPAVMWQAEDRVHRQGQKQKVSIYSYWMKDSIDESIDNILRKKELMFHENVDGLSEETLDELFTMDDLLEIIGVKRGSVDKPTYDLHKWANLSVDEILNQLLEIPPKEFENLVSRLMHYLGYPNVKVTKASHDGGLDVVSTRIIETGIERIAAQCKRYSSPIGVKIAREFIGAIQSDKSIVKGYLVTTSTFTPDCITYCIQNGIEMIPGIKMAEYVKQFGLDV